MRTEAEVLEQLTAWARRQDVVRAAVLTSSRVRPGREIDALSDYDVELYVADLGPFRGDDDWLAAFGPILVRWPYRPRSTFSAEWLTRLVLFRDGVRIDFQITERREVAPDAYDDGCRVLVDKDGILARLAAPTFSAHDIARPSREDYETLVHEFWWDAAYVPRCLWRDELPFAASMMALLHDEFLRPVIEWSIGFEHDWSVNTGVCGRWFRRHLDDETWRRYEATFAGADPTQSWEAFFATVELFGSLAAAVGRGLGYDYPARLQAEMVDYYRRIRRTERGAGKA